MNTKQVFIYTATHTEIIQNLSEKLKAYYVFPDVAEQISMRLQKHLDSGEYIHITDGEHLSTVLTEHIQEVNQDKHLRVCWYLEPLPNEKDPLPQNQEWQDERHLLAKLDNYGLHKVERLPGNVGYIDIREFHNPSWCGDTAVAAMIFFSKY